MKTSSFSCINVVVKITSQGDQCAFVFEVAPSHGLAPCEDDKALSQCAGRGATK